MGCIKELFSEKCYCLECKTVVGFQDIFLT